jgi:hypothetical protein
MLQLLFYISFGFAHAMVFKTDTANSANFQKWVLQKNQSTYTSWYLAKINGDESEAHPQVAEFAQNLLRAPGKINKRNFEDWAYLRNVIDLNHADREMLYLLAEKLDVTTEFCRYALLEREKISKCLERAAPLPNSLRNLLEPRDLLLIDGKAFRKDQLPKVLMPGSYQWKIISDQYQDRGYIGTAENMGAQKFRRQSWVTGQCADYKLHQEDFSILTQAQIYFEDACVVPGLPPVKSFQTWAEDHKGLLWTVGILVGGLALYQLKDKNLVVTRP